MQNQEYADSKIIEQLRNEINELRKTEESLVFVIESGGIGTWDFDIDTGIAIHSLRHDQIFGYTTLQTEWSYEISVRHILPEYHSIVREAVARALETGVLSYDAMIKWPDGSLHWIALRGRVTYSPDGKPVRMGGIVSDITEQKEIEEAISESELRYRQLFNSMSETFQVIELIYDENKKAVDYYYREVNPAYEKLIGKSKDELIGKRVRELFNIKGHWFSFFDKVYQTGEPVRFEIVGDILDRFYDVLAWKTNDNNIAIIFTDITERKKAQEELHINQERLQQLNATKDKLFSIISHDLRSPFASIIGLSELIIENLKENNFQGIEELITIIHNSSWQAMDLLSNLMEWSTLQTGVMKYTPEETDLVPIINEVTALLNGSAHQKSITISAKVSGPIMIYADRAMISTILRNLISNAIKFTHFNGNIIIVVDESVNHIRVEVADNGVGMSRELIDSLFRNVENISSPGTRNETGTGLGLILCKEFVHAHGGEIRAESEIGKGSRFYFTIPKRNIMPDYSI